jgi:UDP-N-acetylmuramate: L-alanyl-gamma-D-glutamyl-meso-diaminopimelate ligase
MAAAVASADRVWFLNSPGLGWDLEAALRPLGARLGLARTVEGLADRLAEESRAGDHVVIMSNGGFGGLHEKLLTRLRLRQG